MNLEKEKEIMLQAERERLRFFKGCISGLIVTFGIIGPIVLIIILLCLGISPFFF